MTAFVAPTSSLRSKLREAFLVATDGPQISIAPPGQPGRLRRGRRSLLAQGKDVVFYTFTTLDADHFAHGLDVVQPIIFF
jgi:hypothetical protein